MENCKHRRALWSIFLLLIFASLAFSGTTGKITGRVMDASTGEPLPGANILVEGTMLGTAADLDGYYTILHVPPGIHTVSVSVIGYTKLYISDVRIHIDQTATVNAKLEMEAIEGETVTIVAAKNIIKKDVSTSVVAVTDAEVEELPVSTVEDVVGLQAGIRGLSVRGGGEDEALFQMDGVTLRDPRNNLPITGIALSAIKEISVERGGFNAEYGQVRSGIVNVITKEGNPKEYSGSVTFRYSPPAKKYFGISPFDRSSFWLKPYFDDDVCWTGTSNGAWSADVQKQYPEFKGWNEVSRIMIEDQGINLTPAECQRIFMWETRKEEVNNQPDYNVDAGFGGPVPFIGKKLGNLRFFTSYRREREMLLVPLTRDDYVDYDWNWQLISDISPSMKLKISGLTGKVYTMADNWTQGVYLHETWQISDLFDDRSGRLFGTGVFSLADIGHQAYAAKLTHMLGQNSFYELSLEHIISDYDTRAAQRRDTTLYEIVSGYYRDEAPFGYSPSGDVGIDGMLFGSHTCKARDASRVSATTLKADFNSQVNRENLVKAGLEFVYNDLDIDFGTIASLSDGNTYDDHVQMHVFPVRVAAYVQDKLEAQGFIVNAGLRLDYSSSNSIWWDLKPFDYDFFTNKYSPSKNYITKETSSQWQLSPRFGISHPITETSKLFFNYGHFKQLPSYQELFRIGRDQNLQVKKFGDPDMTLAKTVSYELGFDHVIGSDVLFQVAAFYHDIVDQQDSVHTIGISGIDYNQVTSNSYEDIRGFELTLRKTRGIWWTGFANYTYQVNTRGHFGSQEFYEDPSEQKKYNEATDKFYQEKPLPRPYARVDLTLYTPDDFGPAVLGMNPLGGFACNLLFDYQAGNWRDWNPKGIKGLKFNIQETDYYNVNVRLSKTFAIGKTRLQFFVESDNLLNRRRMCLNNWETYADDERAYYESLHLPKSIAYDNIPGEDRAGDYRKAGVAYQPIEKVSFIENKTNPDPDYIYWESSSGRYMQYVNGSWTDVPSKKMYQILKDKAYIDMPNLTSFTFLDPRQWYYGIRVSFDIN